MVVTICNKCKFFYSHSFPFFRCLSPDVPYSDFVRGIKHCEDINKNGQCIYYVERKICKECGFPIDVPDQQGHNMICSKCNRYFKFKKIKKSIKDFFILKTMVNIFLKK